MTLFIIIALAILAAAALWHHGARIYTVLNRIVGIGLAAGVIYVLFFGPHPII
jgi:hypothetical protein